MSAYHVDQENHKRHAADLASLAGDHITSISFIEGIPSSCVLDLSSGAKLTFYGIWCNDSTADIGLAIEPAPSDPS